MIRTAWSDGAAFCVAILLLVSPLVAHAESRAEFDQLVQQLSANPGDNALRERIIKLAQGIKPPPAIPEEARRHFIQATAIAKTATNAAGQGLAIQSYREALKLAPWWGHAYYNLAVSQQLAGQLAEAKQSLKFYLMTNPSAKDEREAQDRIYAIEGQERLAQTPAEANSPTAHAANEQDSAAALIRSLDGVEFFRESYFGASNQILLRQTLRIRGMEGVYTTWSSDGTIWSPAICIFTGLSCNFHRDFTIEISTDGRRATRRGTQIVLQRR